MGNTIDLAIEGECVTRNGVSRVSRMVIKDEGDGTVSLGFVSEKLKRVLHAGAHIGAADFDGVCLEWLSMRGWTLPLQSHGR